MTRPATSPPIVWTATAGTSTVMFSDTVPGSSFTFTARTSATFSATPLTTEVLNPLTATSIA